VPIIRAVRIRLDLAYLGTGFEGWQVQDAGRPGPPPRTVQGELERALGEIYLGPVRAQGAGRTDAGVHADGQVAHFDEPEAGPRVPPHGLLRALNAKLPDDVRVLRAAEAPPGFHARFSAEGKIYEYRLRRGEVLHPHLGLVEALAREPLDVPRMRAAGELLVGTRDFAPFSLTGSPRSSTVRTLRRLEIAEEGSLLVLTLEGDGFLRGMARRLVGTLREVGRGALSAEDAPAKPGPTAEARGLTLKRVLYPPADSPPLTLE
jgi:tRNA pseudouridine38-40 synthase